MRKNLVLFGIDASSYGHTDNKNTDILSFGERLTKRLDDITLTAEAKYPINFTQSSKWFVLSLHCNGNNTFLHVSATKIN